MAQASKVPTTFADGLNAAMQDISSALLAPDADIKFGMALIGAIGSHVGRKQQQQPQPQPLGAGAGGGLPSGGSPGGGPGGLPPGGPPGAGGPAGGIPGGSMPGGPGSQGNSAQPNQQAPGPPTQGGINNLSQGLTPNPDELRRVLADVAGQ